MTLPRTATAGVLDVRNLYEAGILSRPQAIAALVSLGFAPGAAAAIFGDGGRARVAALAGLIDGGPALAQSAAVPRYPSNAPVDRTESLRERVRALITLLEARVRRHAASRNLLIYDGSIFDQLTHSIVTSVLSRESYEVICALRPCMSQTLQNEVSAFAAHHGYQTLGYGGECQVDFASLQVTAARCSNVSPRISAHFKEAGGVLYVGGPSTDDHLLEMEAITDFYGRSVLHYDEGSGDVLWETVTRRGHTFRTVLLLHGLMPYELVACGMVLAEVAPQPWHVPECYLPCHFEIEKRRVRAVIERCSSAIAQALREGDAPASPSLVGSAATK